MSLGFECFSFWASSLSLLMGIVGTVAAPQMAIKTKVHLILVVTFLVCT